MGVELLEAGVLEVAHVEVGDREVVYQELAHMNQLVRQLHGLRFGFVAGEGHDVLGVWQEN